MVLLSSGGLVEPSPVVAQRPPVENPFAVPLSQLPVPPPELQVLIDAGSVKLEAGRNAPSRVQGNPKITGATRYNIEYNYRSRSQWRIDRGRRQLIITVRYQRIDWEP
ncbi:MAG: hypothetical protein ACR2NZ_01395, partial [Rubripirellula sp.]